MSDVIFGSARIDERGKTTGGQAGIRRARRSARKAGTCTPRDGEYSGR